MNELLDQLPYATFVTNGDGQVLFANAELLALSGRSLSSCQATPMDSLFPPASRIILQTDVWPTLLREGRISEVCLQLASQGQSQIPVYLSSRCGSWQGASAYFWSIFVARQRQEFEAALLHARERAEASQRLHAQSEQFARDVTDLIPSMVSFWGRDLQCRFANKAHFGWFTRDPSSFVGCHFRELMGEEVFAADGPAIAEVLGGRAQTFERAVAKASGELGHALIHYIPQAVNGEVTGFLVVVSDITLLKNAERKAQEMSADLERLALVARRTSNSVVITDAQRRITWVNAGFERLSGFDLAEVIGHSPGDLLQCDATDTQTVQAMRAALDAGEGFRCDLLNRGKQGQTYWTDIQIEPLRDEQGALTGFMSIQTDITTRRISDQRLAAKSHELKRSNEDLERFAYVASHDLQEPLRMVTSYGQLLTRRHLSDLKPEAQEFVAYMVDGGQRAQALIRDLLSLARLDSQAKPWAPVSLEALLAEALRPLRPRVQETGAQITHDPLPTVVGDVDQLGQLMANLVGNALKFCGKAAPVVHLGAVQQGSGWRISVRDNGIGIEPRYFDRVFQMFQRLHLRTEYDGTGIGLAICKKVVERHGGHIGVESTPGQGATFFFTMPDHAQGARPTRAPRPSR